MGQLELLVASGRKSNDIQSNSDLNINNTKKSNYEACKQKLLGFGTHGCGCECTI